MSHKYSEELCRLQLVSSMTRTLGWMKSSSSEATTTLTTAEFWAPSHWLVTRMTRTSTVDISAVVGTSMVAPTSFSPPSSTSILPNISYFLTTQKKDATYSVLLMVRKLRLSENSTSIRVRGPKFLTINSNVLFSPGAISMLTEDAVTSISVEAGVIRSVWTR